MVVALEMKRRFYELAGPMNEEDGAAKRGPSVTDRRKEFMRRWIAYGGQQFNKAESFGIEWDKMSFEKMNGAIVFAEEFSKNKETI